MSTITPVTLFFVGIGAPAHLYTDYLDDLKNRLPETKLHVIEWWNQPDFDTREIESYIDHSELTLIAHSAGGVIALQVLEKWFNFVKKNNHH